MTYLDIIFLLGFFLVVFFFVGCKHKPTTLVGWIVFAVISFTVSPFISVPLTWYVCKRMDQATGKNKEYLDMSDFTFK